MLDIVSIVFIALSSWCLPRKLCKDGTSSALFSNEQEIAYF